MDAAASEISTIRLLATEPYSVRVTERAKYDLLAHDLTKYDICDSIVDIIDGGERVKEVILRKKHSGQTAFEMKTMLNGVLFYIKVTICEPGQRDEYLLLLSAHPDE